jgi:hypothetical protein
MHRFSLLVFLLFTAIGASAQDLTGTWEGTEDMNYMKLTVIRVGGLYVGFTFDEDQRGGYCRANFRGVYWNGEKKLKGKGTGMIRMRGGHVLCYYDLAYTRSGTQDLLSGPAFTLYDDGSHSNFGPSSVVLRRTRPDVDTTEYMRSFIEAAPPGTTGNAHPAPKTVPPSATDRAPERLPTTRRTTPTTNPPAPGTAPPVVRKPATTPVRNRPQRDTIAVVKPTTPVITTAPPARRQPVNPQLVQLRQERNSTIVQELSTDEPVIIIKVFDNGVLDGDTISILHNNEVLVDHKLVPVQSFSVTMRLDDGSPTHDITLIAHNVGTIPPNTASIIIEAGEARYRLTASTDLTRNAVIRIRYEPKK